MWVDEDEPQRQPAARVQPQISAIAIDVVWRGHWRSPAKHRLRPQESSSISRPRVTVHVTDPAAIVFIGGGSGDCRAAPGNQSPGPRIIGAPVFWRSAMKTLFLATAILGFALAPAAAEAKGASKAPSSGASRAICGARQGRRRCRVHHRPSMRPTSGTPTRPIRGRGCFARRQSPLESAHPASAAA